MIFLRMELAILLVTGGAGLHFLSKSKKLKDLEKAGVEIKKAGGIQSFGKQIGAFLTLSSKYVTFVLLSCKVQSVPSMLRQRCLV